MYSADKKNSELGRSNSRLFDIDLEMVLKVDWLDLRTIVIIVTYNFGVNLAVKIDCYIGKVVTLR